MLLSISLLILFLSSFQSKHIYDSSFNGPIAQEPHWWKVIWMKYRVQELRVLLPYRIYRLLHSDPQLALVLKESLQAALASCKQSKLEKDEDVTCTYQRGRSYGDLFKTISAYDSRDFSFLLSLTTAFAVRGIAEACAEGRLKHCSCNIQLQGPIPGRPSGFVWSECSIDRGSHNLPYALKLSKKLIDEQYECIVPSRLREILLHNISVGRTRVNTTIRCFCGSIYGCNERICQSITINESEILNRVRESLWDSRRIRRSNHIDMKKGNCRRRNIDKKNRNKSSSIWYIDEGIHSNIQHYYIGIPE